MMAYEQKPNSGALFTNKKMSEKHPDMKGDVYLDKTFLIDMMDKSKGSLVKIGLAGWNNTSKSGMKYMSLLAAEPYEKEKNDDDLPY
jgi:hypothetical protein